MLNNIEKLSRLDCPIKLNSQQASFDDVAIHALLRQRLSRHWCAIGKLINTKLETKRFDIYDVRDWLGHSEIQTTMTYVRDAKQYMRQAPFDWFKYIMKKG